MRIRAARKNLIKSGKEVRDKLSKSMEKIRQPFFRNRETIQNYLYSQIAEETHKSLGVQHDKFSQGIYVHSLADGVRKVNALFRTDAIFGYGDIKRREKQNWAHQASSNTPYQM